MVLQSLLGGAFSVENDGHSGATMMSGGNLPYLSVDEYATSTAWAANGGDVVIQLGTNDSKPTNWSKKASFLTDCEALVEHYLAAPGQPRVWLNLIPPATTGACCSINGAVIESEIVPLLRTCAEHEGASTIDVFGALASRLDTLTDGVHPNDQGAALIAETVHAALVRLPTISLSASSDLVTEPGTITLSVTAAAAYGRIERVAFFEDGTLRGEAVASPWALTLDGLSAGAHLYSAKATETRGRSVTSESITVTVTPRAMDPARADDPDASVDASNASPEGSAPARGDAAAEVARGGGSPTETTGQQHRDSSDEPTASSCHLGRRNAPSPLPTSIVLFALAAWATRRRTRA
jgi:hypothetical protein